MLNLAGFKRMTCRETVKDFVISALNLGGFKSINCKETVKDFVTSDQEFHFVKGISAYWESF